MIQPNTFGFLKELSENNNREWFNEHKVNYERARDDFAAFVNALISKIETFDHHLTGLSAKECLFRIYRDIRFSKNKNPYKTNFGAYIAFGGRKSNYAGYFIHLSPSNCFIGSGMYKPGTPVLRKIRQEIDYNPIHLKRIIHNRDFVNTFGKIQGEQLATAPQGYPKDHPEIELLKFKSFFVMHNFNDQVLLEQNALEYCTNIFKMAFPFNRFFNETFIS
ncbi:MAG: DUF2461 domain-containing protein [Bacteroidia bacterium]